MGFLEKKDDHPEQPLTSVHGPSLSDKKLIELEDTIAGKMEELKKATSFLKTVELVRKFDKPKVLSLPTKHACDNSSHSFFVTT